MRCTQAQGRQQQLSMGQGDELSHGKPQVAQQGCLDLRLQNFRRKSEPLAMARIGDTWHGDGGLDVI